jgi:hypothetical protein
MNVVARTPAVPEPRPELVAGARPTAIIPRSMDEAYRLAKAIVLSGTAPKGVTTPEACMIAIMHGLEIGLPPLAALQRISVINGRPTLWGDAAIGLVRGSGLCEYVEEHIDGEVAICAAKRKGEPEPIVRTFSVTDAKRAGLWGKSGPWQQYPQRMLQMRARAFALRDGFADVLGGLYLREEIDEDERSSRARDVSTITSGVGNKRGQLPPAKLAQHPPQPTPPSPPPQPIPPQPEDGDEDWPPPPADEDMVELETPPKDPMHEDGASPPAEGDERQKLFEAGRGAAERGTNALLRWLNKLPPSQRDLIGDTAIDLLRSIAKEAAPSPSP